MNRARGSDQLVTAARQNTRKARDREDLRQLLDALGLTETPRST
ncbi:hypothetical protein ACF1G4_03420 [Streptomyces caelestis]